MIHVDLVSSGVDSPDLKHIRDALHRLNRGPGVNRRVTVIDGSKTDDLPACLAPPTTCVIDAQCGADGALALEDSSVLTLRVSTATANRLDVAEAFAAALERRRPGLAGQAADIRYALQEAIGNAVIHGNLGLDGTLRGSLESLRVFAAMMDERMADADRSRRPITIIANDHSDGITVSVEDCGDGFSPDTVKPTDNPAAGGMGLVIIRMYCRSIAFDLGGRRIAMTFSASPPA